MHQPKFALLLCLALCAGMSTFANPTPTPSPSPTATPAVKARSFPFQSVVVSVDKAARTFRMGKNVVHQVHVLPETKIAKGDGTAAGFEALAPGTEVRGSVRKRSDADWDAVSIKIGPKPTPSSTPTPQQKK